MPVINPHTVQTLSVSSSMVKPFVKREFNDQTHTHTLYTHMERFSINYFDVLMFSTTVPWNDHVA